MATAVQEKIDDARDRMRLLLQELEDDVSMLRRTLEHPTGDTLGVKMRVSGIQEHALRISFYANRFVTLLELPYRLDGSFAEKTDV